MSKVEAAVADPYARITGRILEQLKQGVRPWTKPWSAEHLNGRVTRPLRATGEAYQGINVLLLWMEAVAAGHPSPTWMTYRQAQAFGAQVRKGERGCPVVYFGATTMRDAGESGPEREDDSAREVRFLKTYTVFNVGQIEGLPERFTVEAPPSPSLPIPERLAHADAFLGALGVDVRQGGAQAYYSAAEDRIQLPPLEAFHNAEGYYTTWAMRRCTPRATLRGSSATSDASGSGTKAMPVRSWWRSWEAPSLRPILVCTLSPGRITPPIWRAGSRCCRATSALSSRPPPTRSGRSSSCMSCRRRRRRPPDRGRGGGRHGQPLPCPTHPTLAAGRFAPAEPHGPLKGSCSTCAQVLTSTGGHVHTSNVHLCRSAPLG